MDAPPRSRRRGAIHMFAGATALVPATVFPPGVARAAISSHQTGTGTGLPTDSGTAS
jgi:hypothetical protein